MIDEFDYVQRFLFVIKGRKYAEFALPKNTDVGVGVGYTFTYTYSYTQKQLYRRISQVVI